MTDLDAQLFSACKQGDAALCVSLLAHGANIEATSGAGRSPLHEAVLAGYENVCLALLEHGANVNVKDARGDSPLHCVIHYAHSPIFLMLLDHECNVNAVNKYGASALHKAAHFGYASACLTLIERGADPLLKDNNDNTALDQAIQSDRDACASVISAWLSAKSARAALQEIGSGRAPKGVAP